MKVTDLKENEVIHCETLEQYDAICKLLHEAGYLWVSGKSYMKKNKWWYKHRNDTCIYPLYGVILPAFNILLTHKIHPATDFITPPQTKEEYAKERAIGFFNYARTWDYENDSQQNCFYRYDCDNNLITVNPTVIYDEYLKSINQKQ